MGVMTRSGTSGWSESDADVKSLPDTRTALKDKTKRYIPQHKNTAFRRKIPDSPVIRGSHIRRAFVVRYARIVQPFGLPDGPILATVAACPADNRGIQVAASNNRSLKPRT